MPEQSSKAKKIRLMIIDVDNAPTDSNLYFGDNGVEYKTFNPNAVQLGMENLGIKHLYQGCSDRLPV